MPMIRPNALRSLQSSLRYSGARATIRAAPARTQLVGKRFASSDGHGGHGEASSDLPWLLAALAITPPSCWYLWPEKKEGHGHGHGDHGDHAEHSEEKEESSEEPSGEEEQASGGEEQAVEEADEKKEDKPEVKSEEKSDDKKEEKSDDKADEKKEEKSDDKEGKKSDDKAEKSEEKKDSNKANEGNDADGAEDQPAEALGSGSKTTKTGQKLGETDSGMGSAGPKGGGQGSMAKKQEGISNTDTKHSMPIDLSSEKSTKVDGSPETAKAKGTVDISKGTK